MATGPEVLFYLQLTSDPVAPPPPALPQQLRAITPLSGQGVTEVEINFGHDPATNQYIMRVDNQLAASHPVVARVGETQLWHIGNGSTYDHPFHLHGFFFHEVDFENKAVTPIQWKDTINVGARAQVDVLVRFDERPGMWMFHCHILDHAEVGLMGMVHLSP
jgi:FtsP/CotA-like multicopper oxidase with cupredoxin domain